MLQRELGPSGMNLIRKVHDYEVSFQSQMDALSQEIDRGCRASRCEWRDLHWQMQIPGFSPVKQTMKRQHSAMMRSSDPFLEYDKKRSALLVEFGNRLLEINADYIEERLHPTMFAVVAMRMARQARGLFQEERSSVGSQPSHVDYKEIMARKKLIDDHAGRKPPASCYELELTNHEQSTAYDWARWWMQIAGFDASFTTHPALGLCPDRYMRMIE